MRKINVYCGETVENMTGLSYHPVTQFKLAKDEIETSMIGDYLTEVYSNSPDYVSAIFYLAEDRGIPVELFLNGESCGNNLEMIFSDFNRFYDLLDENTKNNTDNKK